VIASVTYRTLIVDPLIAARLIIYSSLSPQFDEHEYVDVLLQPVTASHGVNVLQLSLYIGREEGARKYGNIGFLSSALYPIRLL